MTGLLPLPRPVAQPAAGGMLDWTPPGGQLVRPSPTRARLRGHPHRPAVPLTTVHRVVVAVAVAGPLGVPVGVRVAVAVAGLAAPTRSTTTAWGAVAGPLNTAAPPPTSVAHCPPQPSVISSGTVTACPLVAGQR